MSLSDEDLMLAAGRGDLAAFGEIVRRHQTAAWGAAYRFLGDAAEAEDAAQEAFLKILDAAPHYRPTASFRTFLYRVVSRLCLDRARKMKPVYTGSPPAGVNGSPSPLEALAAAERDRAVQAALARLPEKQRLAVVLRHFQDLSYGEIADALGASEKAVERLLARAHAALGALLADVREGE